jgi:TRAP-type transport system periplasmic protein
MGKLRIITKAAAVVFVVTILVVLGTGPANAGKIVIKAGSTNAETPTDPYAMGVRQFQKALELLAPGQFEIQYFPARQIGDEKELIEGLSFGTVDLAVITNAVIANVETAFMLNDLPFLYANEAQAHEVLDGTVGNLLMAKLASKKIVGLGFIEGGFRNMINNKRPVATPADVEGVKFRVMQNPVYVQMFSSLGGNAVPMAFSEVFTATQQGTIDGLELPVAVINSQKYYEVTKYLSLTKHTYSAIGLLMSQKTYDKLNETQRIAVWRAAEIAKTEERRQNGLNEKAILAELAKKGMIINNVNDPAAFRAKVGNVYDMFRPKIGSDLLNMALEEVQ